MKKVFLIFIACLAVQFVLISRWVAYSESITDVEENINLLKKENESLELRFASLVSVSAIEARALSAGFTKIIAKNEFSVALKR